MICEDEVFQNFYYIEVLLFPPAKPLLLFFEENRNSSVSQDLKAAFHQHLNLFILKGLII